MKIYCPDCGGVNVYTSKKPNFCQNCGKSFGVAKASSLPPAESRAVPITSLEVDFEDCDEENFQITAQGLDVEIEGGMQMRGVRVADLAGTAEPTEKPAKRKKGGRFTKKAKEQFLQDFAKEAGTSRRSGKKT